MRAGKNWIPHYLSASKPLVVAVAPTKLAAGHCCSERFRSIGAANPAVHSQLVWRAGGQVSRSRGLTSAARKAKIESVRDSFENYNLMGKQ